MWTMQRIGATTLAGLAVLGLTAVQAQGQFFRGGTLPVYGPGINPRSPFYNSVNPFTLAAPGMTNQQALYNTFQPLWAASRLPPWMYGYNPYPSPIITSGPVIPFNGPTFGSGAFSNPYGGGYGGNPYGGGYGGGSGGNVYGAGYSDPSNPYGGGSSMSWGGGYNPYSYFPPYGTDALTGLMYGSASVVQAQGKLMISQEQARMLREVALQEQLRTKKLRFDTEKYIKDNTPTFGDIQAKNLKDLVKRIQINATPGEISSGRAMNILLKDVSQHQEKKAGLSSMPLDEDVLKRLNITNTDRGANLGFLRNDGQFAWPAGLLDLVPEKERSEIEDLAKGLYRLAVQGELKANLPRDLEDRLAKLQEQLRSKVNEVPSGQYIAATRFLTDFRSAVAALTAPNLIPAAMSFQRWVRGGKTAQEIADYMIANGLFFAPANAGDEGAYSAVHTGLANYDLTLHAQVASNR
jgi:hypothetical protein